MAATTIELTLVNLISNSAALASLIGSGDTARIYPALIPQGGDKTKDGHAAAAIAFNLIDAERPQAFGKDTGLCRSRYQFSCWADDMDTARNVAEGLRKTLQRYRDYTGANGVPIQDCFLLTQNETFDEDVESHGVLVDYEVIWQEGV